jgi:Tol biopolymer transport system component
MAQAASETPESSSLWMTSTQGEGTVRLTTGHGVALSPVWSRSDQLFFVSNRDGVENVWAMRMQDAVRTASALTRGGEAAMAVTLTRGDNDEPQHTLEEDQTEESDAEGVETASESDKDKR